MSSIQGFPVLAGVNQARENLFKFSHEDSLSAGAVVAWLGHKALSVVCIPCNIVAAGVGAIGMVATATTLGSLKVAIYAATVGNVKPSFPIGFLWLGERTIQAVVDCGLNASEFIYDAGNLVYQAYRLVKWVAKKIHFGDFIKKALQAIGDAFEVFAIKVFVPAIKFVARRIEAGLKKAMESEVSCQTNDGEPFFIKPINDISKEMRIDLSSQERLLSTIAKHYAISIVNIPVNVAAAIFFTATSILLSAAFVGKASLYAVTHVHVPVPTFAEHSIRAAASTTSNAIADVATNVADPFILIYKAAYALRLNRVMATALDVLLYVPQAVFS